MLKRLLQPPRPAEIQAHGHLGVALWTVQVHLVAAAALGEVTGDVGVGQHLPRRMRVTVDERHADAAVNLVALAAIQKVVLIQHIAEIFRDRRHVARDDVAQNHGELVAAEACEQIGIAQARLQLLADFDQQLVTGGMAGGVVEVLETIEINVQQRRYFLAALEALHLGIEGALEMVAVMQLGEWVVGRLPQQFTFEQSAFGDVAKRHHRTLRPARNLERIHRALDRNRPPGAMPEHRLETA